MPVRDEKLRRVKYEAKIDPDVVRARFAAQKEDMIAQVTEKFVSLAGMENAIKDLLGTSDMKIIEIPYYLNFSRELFAKIKKFSGKVLDDVVFTCRSKWQNYGLDGLLLDDILAYFGLNPRPADLVLNHHLDRIKIIDDIPFVLDSTVYKNNGQVDGAVLTKGKLGNSLVFDGDDVVVVNHDDSLNFGIADFSIEAWVKISGGTEGDIVSKWDEEKGYVLWNQGTVEPETLLTFHVDSGEGKLIEANTPFIEWNRWYHLVGVKKENKLEIYLDGNLEDEQLGPLENINNTRDVTIGSDSMSGDFFNGMIDEVRIYNRALTESEVKNHFLGKS